jgi:AcrR family transcriptional regulator
VIKLQITVKKGIAMSIRIPKQNRSRERRLRIMETALDLFASKGINKTTSNEIAQMADLLQLL